MGLEVDTALVSSHPHSGHGAASLAGTLAAHVVIGALGAASTAVAVVHKSVTALAVAVNLTGGAVGGGNASAVDADLLVSAGLATGAAVGRVHLEVNAAKGGRAPGLTRQTVALAHTVLALLLRIALVATGAAVALVRAKDRAGLRDSAPGLTLSAVLTAIAVNA